MYFVYILYSNDFKKSYTGYTNNLKRRIHEHNETETSGFTLRYRPWTLIRIEEFNSKAEAMAREKFLKTGRGREAKEKFILQYLRGNGAVSAAAEMD